MSLTHLSQIRKLAHTIVNSTTLLLPAWYAPLDRLRVRRQVIPRDVTTRWNLTYTMLNFVIKHRISVTGITQDLKNGLRKFELSEEEWEIAEQLRDVLKVSVEL